MSACSGPASSGRVRPILPAFLLLSALLPSVLGWAVSERGSGPKVDESGAPVDRGGGIPASRPQLYARPPGNSPLAGIEFDLDLRKLENGETLFTSTG
ncbi:MAG: hypothetical protein O6947_06875, partial [Acidobacteria bacterium]|nr:hypothetical protein [Acidobacteriota bacterium]